MSGSDENAASATQNRRGSFTTQTFNSIFGRSNSTGGPTGPFPGPISTAAAQDQRRRVSISTLGLSGTSPTQASPFPFGRRSSISTDRSDSIDESAIDDDDGPQRQNSNASFTRRMSVGAQALRARSNGGSPGASGESGGFNWSEQLRSRAESSVSQSQRPSFSTSPSGPKSSAFHERAKSVEMPGPPQAAPAPAPPKPARKQPDAFQERILKGDFYMD